MQTLERPSSNGHAGHATTVVTPPRRRRIPWRIVALIAAALVLIAGIVTVVRMRAASTTSYVSQPVERGDLAQTVTATGTLNPQNTINVGTQVSGTISEVDVDYNAKVRKGQVLARIDPTALQAQLASAEAALAQAKAQAASAVATARGATQTISESQATVQTNQAAIANAQTGVVKAQSALGLAQATVARDRSLLAQGYVAQNQVDSDTSNLVAAQTALQSAQIAVQQARSTVAASVAANAVAGQSADATAANADAERAAIGIQEAAVEQAQTNLAHAVITSPVDGTVIARDVSVGTTVAASLQTPTLFAIAQNLDKMEVDLAVGEPDIGSVKPGEAVSFTVLAYPNRTFRGTVSQVRKNPVTTSNVVTYTTVVLVDNDDQALLPGMTANATIDVQDAKNALLVPAAALTFRPTGGGSTAHRTHPAQTSSAAAGGSPWGATLGGVSSTPATGGQGRIFVERNGTLVRVPVQIVLATSTQAAVTPLGDAMLAAGDAVVTGDAAAAAARPQRSATTQSPFTGGAPAGMRGIGR